MCAAAFLMILTDSIRISEVMEILSNADFCRSWAKTGKNDPVRAVYVWVGIQQGSACRRRNADLPRQYIRSTTNGFHTAEKAEDGCFFVLALFIITYVLGAAAFYGAGSV